MERIRKEYIKQPNFAVEKITPRNPQAFEARRQRFREKKEQAQRRDELRLQIQKEINAAYFSRKKTGENIDDDLFMVGKGMHFETGEQFGLVGGEIGQHYDAHGIAKTDQLDKLLNLLDRGIDRNKDFHTAPFEVPDEVRAGMGAGLGTSGGTAKKDGIAVITGGYGKKLDRDGIKHVFVNDVYAAIKDPLQELYPQYQVHLLSEQKKILEGETPVQSTTA